MRRAAVLLSVPFACSAVAIVALIAAATAGPPESDKRSPATDDAPSEKPACVLRYKFEANQVVHIEVVHNSTITITHGGATETQVQESKSDKHFRVVSVDGSGAAILEPTIDRVGMSVRSGVDSPVTYDSQSGEAPPPQFRGIGQTIGSPLVQMKIAANGELLETVRRRHPGLQLVSAERVGGVAVPDNDPSRNFLIVFPDEPVRVGGTWSDRDLKVPLEVTRGLRQEFEILRSYELVSVKGPLATIRLKAMPLKPLHNPELEARLIQYLHSGTIVFDLEKGQIVSRKLKVDDQVIGFAGQQSLLRVTSERIERTVEACRK